MKKWLICLLLLLAGCATGGNTPSNNSPIENQVVDEVSDKNFHMKLESAKDVYKVGEPIEVHATLTNKSNEKIQIGHGESWIAMGTTNLTEDYRFDFSVTEPYIMRYMEPNDTITDPYRFSGSEYFDEQSGNKYSNDIYKLMSDMKFPKGQYEIKGFINFSNLSDDTHYEHELSVIFTVE